MPFFDKAVGGYDQGDYAYSGVGGGAAPGGGGSGGNDFASAGYAPPSGGYNQSGDAAVGGYDQGDYAYSGAGGDTNQDGADSDPFAYTKGSLLTPWSGHFDGSKFGGGGGGPAPFKQFNYGDLDYKAANPGTFGETYQDPGNFSYGDYQSPDAFKGVTDKDLKADKGYQFRQEQGQAALTANKAAQGVLKTGGFAKGLASYSQGLASQEYGNVYGRKSSEYDRAAGEGRFAYGTNRANAAENFQTNVGNKLAAYNTRQNTWKDNAAVTLDASRHGFEVASGEYDRNYAKARAGYEDQRTYDNAVASAGAANSNQAYNRALDEYKMGRDEFYTNQDRQYSILSDQANRGYGAARDYSNAQSGLATDRGNVQASGTMGSGNAYAQAAGNIGNGASDAALAYTYGGRGGRGTGPRPSGYPGR